MNGAGRPERRRQTQAERVASVPPGSEVTSVRSVPNQPGRVRVRVGGVSLTMSIEDASSLGLAKGVAWTPALAAHAEEVIAYDGARRDAMAMLARAPLSRRRLAERLTRKGHPAGAIERAAEHAERLGLIDDAALAESAARSIVARRPAGRRLVEAKLRQRGVDGATARAAAERALEDRDPMEDACALAGAKARSLPAGLDEVARRRRLSAMLARRGFDPDVCRAATERALGGADPDD